LWFYGDGFLNCDFISFGANAFIDCFFFFCEGFWTVLSVVLAESALETVPKELWRHSQIRKYAEKKGKKPQLLLLDRSCHHVAMRSLPESEKRGRPDIVHFSLLEALGSPLNKEGLLKVFVHTVSDNVIFVNQETRLPRNYDRFLGLMEQLFELKQIPPKDTPLLTLTENTNLSRLMEEVNPDYVVAFSRRGSPKTVEEAVSVIAEKKNPLVIVGGFPHGTFSESTIKLANEVVAVDREMLETWVVTARVISEYERQIGLPAKRLKDK